MNESTQVLKLDDAAVEARTASYPEEAREGARFLARFVRDYCGRKITVLQKTLREMDHHMDYSTIHKILSGKYFMSDAARPGRVIGSVENFLQMIDALKKQERMEASAGRPPFIVTTTTEQIFDYITAKRQPGRINKFGAVVGWTGTQKTASFEQYQIENNHGLVVHIEAPNQPRILDFITDLAAAYGVPPSSKAHIKRLKITESVNARKCIIIDNVQRLYIAKNEGDQPIFNYLQKLQDDTKCTIILSYTPDFTRTLTGGLSKGYFEQFIGRMGGMRKALVLPDFAPREDVLAIAGAFGLREPARHIKYLESICHEPGRVRILFEDLQAAKQLADADKQPLALEHLRIVRNEEEEAK